MLTYRKVSGHHLLSVIESARGAANSLATSSHQAAGTPLVLGGTSSPHARV